MITMWHSAPIASSSARFPKTKGRSALRTTLLASVMRGALTLAGVTLLSTSLISSPAQAQQQVQRIAAVVNEGVMSLRDVQERLALTMVTSAMPNTPENRQRLLPTVLRTLIDDQLRLQEAERLKITVSDSDISGAMRRIEEGNRMPPGTLEGMLQRSGLPLSALENQIRPQIAWAKATQASLRRQVYVQPEEVDAALVQLEAMKDQPKRRVSELVIPVNQPDQEAQARDLAQRLIEELRNGAQFSALAQQFSASATARQGGDLGWVTGGQLSPEIDDVISQMQPGQISTPVRVAAGYALLMVTDIRQPGATNPADVVYRISQLYIPTNGSAAVSAQNRAQILQQAQAVTSCDDLNSLAEKTGLPSSGDIGQLKLADLPPAIAQTVAGLKDGQVSQPVSLSDAQVVVMVCDRNDPNGLPSRDQVTQRLEREKLERLSERRLRDLRRQALIDVRL
jgi:peptidyl-prolyl cis-trans isomerase SurA